jgi:tetratricopeptide (TPR) repeat protein
VTDERWQLAYAIYEAASPLAEPERSQYVHAAAPDAEIAGKVLAMLDEVEATADSEVFPGAACVEDPAGAPAPSLALPPGAKIGSYEVLERLGCGGMGEVYLAYDPRLDRRVAIKLLPPHLAADAVARERLRREALAAAALDHPFICKVFEIGEDQGKLFMVMEYISGETLYARMRAGPLPRSEALRIAAEVAEALEAAHAKPVVHRDLKPANVMLTSQGRAKVMDFGLAKRLVSGELKNISAALTAGDLSLTAAGTVTGTPEYMSPEQMTGAPLDHRSDLFSFGIILCELLTGKHPFQRNSTVETMTAILRDPPDLAVMGNAGLSSGQIVLIRRLLAKSPDERYQSIREVRDDLARLGSSSAAAAEPEEALTAPIPLIGRDRERAELVRHLERALAGHGSLVLIGGEPGIGKTHLAQAILAEAARRGCYTAVGHCSEMEGAPPYVPFTEMLEHAARAVPRATFRYALGDAAPEVAKLMPELRHMFPDIPPSLELPPEQQRRFLFNAYREYLERAAQAGPVVRVLEDLHWADEPTLLLLQHLAKTVAKVPMLMIGTYRDVELDVSRPFARVLESLLREKRATRMTLRRLPVAGVEQMLAALSAQQPPRSLARVVFEGTEGNPFFVEEVFRHLAEEGKLFDEKGAFRPGLRVDQLQVPEGVRLVLGRRLERLSEDTRRILTTAAVIGRVFPLELLEELEKARPDAALEAVEEAERAHLLETETAGRQTRYRFVHELVRQTLSETLSLPRRQRLHARVAEVMERVYAASIDAHVSALAHHLYQAGSSVDQEKTIHFLSETARQASAAAAHEEALEHLDNAVSLLGNERTVRGADLRVRRAGVLRSLSRDQEAVQEYERALALFESLGDHLRFVETCAPLQTLHMRASQFGEVRAVVERAAQYAKDGSASTRYSVLAMQANTVGAAGEIDRALEFVEELHKIPENELPRAVVGFVAAQEMYTRFEAGQWDLCEAAARKAARIFEQSGDVWSRADVDMGLFWQPLYCGRPAEAQGLILEAVPRAERVGHDVAKQLALVARAGVYMADGSLQSAKRAAREALAFGESRHLGWLFVLEAILGGIVLYLDQIEEALSLLTKAAVGPTTHFGGFPEGLVAFGMSGAEMKRSANACAAAIRFLPRPGTSRGFGAWHAVLSMTEALCLSGCREEAGRLQAEAEKIATEWDTSIFGFPVRTAAGIAAACAGNWTRAEEHHRAAIARMEAVPYVTAQPIARYWYADMLAERRGAEDIQAAKAMFQESIAGSDRIGLALYARLARQRLARIA